MGKMKKSGENSKAVDARNRKKEAKSQANAKNAKDKEDAYWSGQGDGQTSKGKSKKLEQEAKKREAQRKKEEARRLLAAEEAQMDKPKKSPKASVVQKVTRAQLERQREKDEEKMRHKIAVHDRKTNERTVTEDEYDDLVSRPNLNHQTDLIQANSVEAAIAGLQDISVADQPAVDAHPERRLKAAYKAYEEEQLPLIKAELPSLTLKQYKDKLWKRFKKSPQNPVVAARLQMEQQQRK